MRRLVLSLAVLFLLSACGVVARPSVAPAAAPVALASPISSAARAVPLRLDFTRPIHSPAISCDGPRWAGKLTVDSYLGGSHPPVPGHALAIVTLDAPGTPRWNSSDGHRWTQAEAQVAASRGVQPWLVTPWAVHRSGRVYQGPLPDRLTAYVGGGVLGQDTVRDCGPFGHPATPGTYLAALVVDTDGLTYIGSLDAYDPATHVLHTPYGTLTLPTDQG